jgi:signal transduction histidine kinase
LFGWCHGKDYCNEHRTQNLTCNWEQPHSIEQIAGGIAHDFRNILTGIVGNLSIAQIHLDKSSKASVAIKRAEKASMRATDLAQKLMNIGRPAVASIKTVDVCEAIEECVELTLTNKSLRCVIDVDAALADAAIEEGEFCQVINNLLINAVQAMPTGGDIFIHGEEIMLMADNNLHVAEGDYIRIDITDTGSGIPAHILENICEPYFTTKKEGNGLGLASAKKIVEKYLGTISIRSRVGVGTSVSVLLPAA